MSSFDVVSEVDLQEVDNAINQARKEINTRYDFKGGDNQIEFKKEQITLMSDRELFSELYRAAWETWDDYVCSVLPGKTAAVTALHTAGDQLNWHPYLHAIVLAGTVEEDGTLFLRGEHHHRHKSGILSVTRQSIPSGAANAPESYLFNVFLLSRESSFASATSGFLKAW